MTWTRASPPNVIGEKLPLVLLGFVAVALGLGLSRPDGVRFAIAVASGLFLMGFAVRSPRSVLYALILWYVGLGLTRRLVSGLGEKQGYGDPLLLVGAGTTMLLALIALQRGALRNRTHLTSAVMVLTVFLGLSALNPLQGNLAVGLSGAMVVVVPMLAFLVGRALVDDRILKRLLVLLSGLGPLVALYGLYQTFVGFPTWDRRWIVDHGYTALNVGNAIRAFASFSSGSEYAAFLAMSIVVWLTYVHGFIRTSLAVVTLGLLGAALWFESVRNSIVMTVLAVALMLAARARLSIKWALLVGAASLLILPPAVALLAPVSFSNSAGGGLAKHQVEGLSDPLGENSTLLIHVELMVNGIRGAFSDPLGVGVGAVTVSGEKFGSTSRITEVDPGNVAVAAGFPGLIAYAAVLLLAFSRLYQQAALRRDILSFAALGIAIVTSPQWLTGGQYAIAFWPWLLLGWSDNRQRLEDPTIAQADQSRTLPSETVSQATLVL